MSPTPLQFVTDPDHAGLRMDRFLALSHPDLSRARWQQLLSEGHVLVNGQPAKGSMPVRTGDVITAEIPPAQAAEPVPEDIPLTVLYEDSDYIVVDKPPGMVVHQGAGHHTGTLVNALLHHCQDLSSIGGVLRPGIVHRIDKDTSGAMVATKNDLAHRHLAEQFERHTIERVYEAIVWDPFRFSKGTIRGHIERDPRNRLKMSGRTGSGRTAVSHYEVVASTPHFSRVRCRLETGRTHQIRVHLSEAGHPLIGDALYGKARTISQRLGPQLRERLASFPRQALHAHVLGFVGRDGVTVRVEADMPSDMTELWALMVAEDTP